MEPHKDLLDHFEGQIAIWDTGEPDCAFREEGDWLGLRFGQQDQRVFKCPWSK